MKTEFFCANIFSQYFFEIIFICHLENDQTPQRTVYNKHVKHT